MVSIIHDFLILTDGLTRGIYRAGALLAPHPDMGFEDLQATTLKVWQDLADNTPESGVKVGISLIHVVLSISRFFFFFSVEGENHGVLRRSSNGC